MGEAQFQLKNSKTKRLFVRETLPLNESRVYRQCSMTIPLPLMLPGPVNIKYVIPLTKKKIGIGLNRETDSQIYGYQKGKGGEG